MTDQACIFNIQNLVSMMVLAFVRLYSSKDAPCVVTGAQTPNLKMANLSKCGIRKKYPYNSGRIQNNGYDHYRSYEG